MFGKKKKIEIEEVNDSREYVYTFVTEKEMISILFCRFLETFRFSLVFSLSIFAPAFFSSRPLPRRPCRLRRRRLTSFFPYFISHLNNKPRWLDNSRTLFDIEAIRWTTTMSSWTLLQPILLVAHAAAIIRVPEYHIKKKNDEKLSPP